MKDEFIEIWAPELFSKDHNIIKILIKKDLAKKYNLKENDIINTELYTELCVERLNKIISEEKEP